MSTTALKPASETRVLTRYLAAATGARLADEGARVSIVLLALERADDATLGGLLVAALMVPHVLVGPLAGAAADVVRRRRTLYVTAFLTYAVAMVSSAALIGRNAWAAAIVLIVAGSLAPLLLGGLSSLLGELTPATLSRALGLDAATYGAAGIVGPAIAALVAGYAGAAWSMVVLGGFVVLGAAMFTTLPLPPRERKEPQPLHTTLTAGLTVMVRRRRLGAVTVASGLSQIGFGALPLAAALVAADKDQPALTGLIMSITAVGGVVGSLICTRLTVIHRRPERVMLVCVAVLSVPFLLTALLPPVWLLAVLFALAGLFSSPVTVTLFAIRNREAPPSARTQVFTLGAGIKVTAAASGAAASGLFAARGAAALLIAVAACQLLSAAVGALLLRGRNPD